MQHLDARAQVAVKQRVLEDNLERIGKVVPEMILSPIHGPTWGYRYRARFTARLVFKKGGMLVGFHERKSSYVADMTSCDVIPPRISRLLVPLRQLIGGLSISDRVPQVELAIGDGMDVLVLRILEPLVPRTKIESAHLLTSIRSTCSCKPRVPRPPNLSIRPTRHRCIMSFRISPSGCRFSPPISPR